MLSDLRECKKMFDINPADKREDAKISLLITQASAWIEELLGRSLDYKQRAEYYRGTGTQKLLLKARPVYTSGLEVRVDESGYFGSASGSFGSLSVLTYGTDYCLQIDQDDGTSRSGILLRLGNYWNKPGVRQRGLLTPFLGTDAGSIKVTYNAGFLVDNLPAVIREACNFLVARLRYVLPLGVELGSEGYEERSISVITSEKSKLLALVKPLLIPYYRNWSAGGPA